LFVHKVLYIMRVIRPEFFFSLLFSLLLCVFPVFAETNQAINIEQLKSDYYFVSSLFPREEGSENEKKTVSYIKNRLTNMNVQFEEHEFDTLREGHSFSKNIIVDIAGDTDELLILAVPINSIPETGFGSDGSINVVLALSLIEYFTHTTPYRNLKILFLGAEFGSKQRYPIGTGQFLEDFYPVMNSAVLYLNFSGIPSEVTIHCGANNVIAPYWLIDLCFESLRDVGLPAGVRAREIQILRLGGMDAELPIKPYLENEYPAVLLGDSGDNQVQSEENMTVDDFLGKFSRFFSLFVESKQEEYRNEWDRHYLFFQLGDATFIVREFQYIVFFTALLSFLLLFALVFRTRIVRYRNILIRNLWMLIVLFLFVFSFLLIATLFVEVLSMVRNLPTLWRTVPTLFFGLKISFALFLFFLVYWIVRRIPFPIEKSFYSAGAIFLLLLGTIIISFFTISLSYYFFWALLWAFLFTLWRRRVFKIIALIISPLWLLLALFDILTVPSLVLVRYIIFSRFYGNLLIALMLLPFILMIIRIEFFSRYHKRAKERQFVFLFTTMLGGVTAAFSIYLFSFMPYTSENPQPVFAAEQINPEIGQRLLSVSSPAPLTGVELISPDYRDVTAERTRQFSVESDVIPSLVDVSTETSSFLERQYVEITVQSVGSIRSLSVTLHSDERIILFDSNFPFSLNPHTNSAEIYIGENPPNPLTFTFTIPQRLPVEIAMDLTLEGIPSRFELVRENISVKRELTVNRRIFLSAGGGEAPTGQ
jgi:hypothetical protein